METRIRDVPIGLALPTRTVMQAMRIGEENGWEVRMMGVGPTLTQPIRTDE